MVSNTNYRGLIMQVRESSNDGSLSGSFELPNRFRYLNCPAGAMESTITHNSRRDKTRSSFTWNPPTSCDSSNYEIR